MEYKTTVCECEVCREQRVSHERAVSDREKLERYLAKNKTDAFIDECREEAEVDAPHYSSHECRNGDTIKKNNHDVDVDEMLPNDHEAIEKRGFCLRKALEIINGERQDSYGKPEDSFMLIAAYWTAFLRANGWETPARLGITPREVAEMMALFKIARMSGQKTTADNYADAAGYIALAGDMVE